MHPSIALHLDAMALFRGVVSQVSPASLHRPTPCVDWSVRDLLAHQLGQDRAFTDALAGGAQEVAAWAPVAIGADAPAALSAALDEQEQLLRHLDEPETRTIWMPEILPGAPLPALRALAAHTIDLVVHSWDLAVAIGAPLQVPDELVATCLSVAIGIPDAPETRGPGAAFGPALAVPAGDGSFHEVLRRLGRDPAWRPPD